ncbi:MAG: ATP-binding protein, partial [Planctomycetota bacterium]
MAEDEELRSAYARADRDLRVRLSLVGCFLTLLFVPLFWGLDWIVYPNHVWDLLYARLLCDVAIGMVLIILLTDRGRQLIHIFGLLWAVFPCITIAWMVFATEGAESPYYAGLNLVMIVLTLLMPWTTTEVVLICLLTLVLYLGACFGHHGLHGIPWDAMITHSYFLLTTACICITAGVFQSRRRYQEFALRYQLDEQNKELAEMDRLKSQFFANISHELRTPLTLILGPVDELLDQEDASQQTRSSLTLVRQNTLRLLKLINDLLEVVRLENKRLVLHRQRLDLATWVPGLVDAVRHLAESKGIRMQTEGQADKLLVWADPDRLEKVLLNLLTNATKFTEAGGTITTSWSSTGDEAVVQVTDTGIGIDPADLPHIFDRFRQVDGSSTRRYQGLGLGLALARELAEAHGGTLNAHSAPGQGTVFTLRLPQTAPDEAEPQEQTPPARDPDTRTRTRSDSSDDSASRSDIIVSRLSAADKSGLPAARQETHLTPPPEPVVDDAPVVLVIDDEQDMRRFMSTILGNDYRIYATTDAEAGLAMARRVRPDAILLDMMMPGRSGLEALPDLRADEALRDTRIIMLTARGEEEVRLQALRSGADDFLTKPFSSQEVRTRLDNLLRAGRL